MFAAALMLTLLLHACCMPSSVALFFEDGYDHHYTYSSESDILGLHNMTTVIKFRIRHVNQSLHLLMVDSLVQHSQQGYVANNALNWTLDNKFYFTAGSDGLVTLVHYHPQEKDEVLTLKKVLASTLSTNVTIGPGDSFTADEEDHAGPSTFGFKTYTLQKRVAQYAVSLTQEKSESILKHEYTATRTTDGLHISKGHSSSKDVHRSHNKTVHLDLKGTPLHVSSLDNITLRDEPDQILRSNVDGAAEIPEDISGDFPRIASISTSKMKLTAKSKHYESSLHTITDMKQETLMVKQKPKTKTRLLTVESEIQTHLERINSFKNKHDRNRTKSVHDLRDLITSLEHDDFIKLGKSVLTRHCSDDDAICMDERNLFIDIISHEGSPDAQLMMLNYVMLLPNVTEEDLRRCLFHCVTIKSPINELVEYVEKLCFAEDSDPGETPAMSKNRKRACLSLGAMAKYLHEKNVTVSDRLVQKLETWLGHHDQAKSDAIVKPRQRKSVMQQDHRARMHVETKTVLLQSLGNAGKQRSLGHIASYMAPNTGVTAWRRAAIHGLLHFECNESANHLLRSAVEDENEVVRKAALHVLKKRTSANPGSDPFTEDHENIVLSKNYSYPVVSRVRRSLLKTLDDGIGFHLEAPGIEWDKTIGTKMIGAGFGLHVRNILDMKLGVMDGHFSIDIFDGAYAYAHVGLIGLKVDFLDAHVCFKGHVQYDLNVFKDFGIHDQSDLIHMYDKLASKIINPIKEAVKDFKQIIGFFKNLSINDIINNLMRTVKNLPHILGDVAIRLANFVKEIWSIQGSTVIDEIKTIIQQLRRFVDGVKMDILKFYNDIVDPVTIALPFISKKIVEAFNLIVNGVKAMFDNPMQAISGMSRAITDIKTAMTMIVDVKNTVLDACDFIKGRATEWLNAAKELPTALKRLAEAFIKLNNEISNRPGIGTGHNKYADGINQTQTGLASSEDDLKAKWDEVLKPLTPLINIVQPFVDEFKTFMDFIKALKTGYTNIKDVIEKGKMLVQKVFGPKFHKSFPRVRRPKNGHCSYGVWPSTTDGYYDTIGIDLRLDAGQLIKCPVNGIIHDSSKQRLIIHPIDQELIEYEIVIENIDVLREVSVGIRYDAGEPLGRAAIAPKCQPNFIHVAMRQRSNEGVSDRDYKYLDPGPFLDRSVPTPKWVQDCNDHAFIFMGMTFDSGEAAGDATEEKRAIHRNPDSAYNGMDDMTGVESRAYQPDDSSLNRDTPFVKSLTDSIREKAKDFSESFDTALFGKDGPEIPDTRNIVDIQKKKLSWVMDNLKDPHLKAELQGTVRRLCEKMTALPHGNPLTYGIPYMRNILKIHGLPSVTGDVMKLSDALFNVAEKACPTFSGRIAEGYGHICLPQNDCMGIICSVTLRHGGQTKHVQIGITIPSSEAKIVVTVNGTTVRDLNFDGEDEEVDTNISVFGLKLYIVANAETKQDMGTLSAEVKLCDPLFQACLTPIDLFNEIQFQPRSIQSARSRRGAEEQKIITDYLSDHLIHNFMEDLGEFNLLTLSTTNLTDKIRGALIKEAMDVPPKVFGAFIKEVFGISDWCLIDGTIKSLPLDLVIFEVRHLFLVGPVPLSMGFRSGLSLGVNFELSACLNSMNAHLTLTPWLAAMVAGDLSIDIGFAYGGIELVGYLLETKFPIRVDASFSKMAINVGAKLDIVLTPLRLQLNAFAKLRLLVLEITVFSANIWEYATPSISWNIFDKSKVVFEIPIPEFVDGLMGLTGGVSGIGDLVGGIGSKRKREAASGCIVQQVPGRPYYSPAFSIETHAQDKVSDVKLCYSIGTHPGGTNVVSWTPMGGNYLLAPSSLPGGVPLYWTVKAKNSLNKESIQQCSLKTYDNTLPDGRVEHAYQFSSHPSKLHASVVVFDDSPLVTTHYKAIGYSPGKFGSSMINWTPFSLDRSAARQGVSGYLKHFAVPREGKLVAWVIKSLNLRTPELCAKTCIEYGSNCLSFSYEHHSEKCDLHDVVEGSSASLRISGTYSNFERLGTGYNTLLEYNDLEITHGTMYFINSKVTNVLGYDAYLVGKGTMADFTPPEPGHIENALKDLTSVKIIIDGKGSGTVFNGHEPLFDQLYTLTNHYATANWKGFHDDESGIWGYTWAVGRDVCGSDVISFENPYVNAADKKFWTDSAFHKGIHLSDGHYYVTIQALNGVELGGSLVTTVCHSTPFTVDTSPPIFNEVTDIIYDEDFDLIAIYYDAEDDLSKIAKAEFGLGKTKYDVQLRGYSQHASMQRGDPFVATEDLGLKEGVPAWPRIRVTNHVDLFMAGHGDEPILIDKSPPIAGSVLDGDWLRRDRSYQAEDNRICAQWIDFYDPESGIDRFLWGVGTAPETDDVIAFQNLTHYDKSSCGQARLTHNQTYFSTVFAYNNALNSKSTNSSSNGVLVDITSPLPGEVFDGAASQEDIKYSSESVSKHSNWRGFNDPESGIAEYNVDVVINGERKKTFGVSAVTTFEDNTISMEHQDNVYFTVHGVNGAGLDVTKDSDGFIVDHTPPIMTSIADNEHDSMYQSDNGNMLLSWNFYDSESYIGEYRTMIFETKYGVKQKFWPNDMKYNSTVPPSPTNAKMALKLEELNMEDGSTYSLHVTALNGAHLATSHETTGVTVDTSPPQTPTVKLGLPKDEEEEDDDGRVLHNDQHAIRLSWSARDSESGIQHYVVSVGTADQPELISPFVDYGTATTTLIEHLQFQSTLASGVTYFAYVKAFNGARLESLVGKSKEIFVQKANVPGVVFDGRKLYLDQMYTTDRSSIAASFYGFESESCNIMSYDWAIGTTQYGTDVQSYTEYGLVRLNDTHGQAQANMELFDDTTYYITVRAITGCREEFILATSDGITLDRTPPKVTYTPLQNNDTTTIIIHDVLFQDVIDSLAVSSNVTDTHSVASASWALGSLPLMDDRHGFTPDVTSLSSVLSQQPGTATFITADTVDKAGNRNLVSSMAIMSDSTAPEIKQLECTDFLSYRKSVLTCKWRTLVEYDSLVNAITITLTTNIHEVILDKFVLSTGDNSFTKDIYSLLTTNRNVTSVVATFTISNVVGQTKTYGREVVVDVSQPEFERLEVVTSLSQTTADSHQKCQQPRAFVKLRLQGVKDTESDIDTQRYAVSLGLQPYGTEFNNFVGVDQKTDGTFFLDGFMMNVGTTFYATIRVFNKAGLYSDVTSDSVVVSQAPYLTVIDGDRNEDVDYQSVPNLIQGRWEYSDLCPIREAKWTVRDITGNVMFDYMAIPSAGKKFYNDEVALENGKKYVVTVRTIDFLNRTKIARSDGITVRIQPPYPGHVRDGLDEDINYQYSNTELSANWDTFGDGSSDPTQSIDHYNVAIGNDRRYEKTRSNIHYFVNVGLNTSYTFRHLNLTQKLARFYITVRSYSVAGGFTEGYSNGIRVGYHDSIAPGIVTVSQYQSQVDHVEASWTGFQSDIGLIRYLVGVSSLVPDRTNDTLECFEFSPNTSVYDVSNLKSVGLNGYVNLVNLTAAGVKQFFVTVVAEDEAGMCSAVTSTPILVDTTPPTVGAIYINDVKSTIISFATSALNMNVRWDNFEDPESGIQDTKVSLLECKNCSPNEKSNDCYSVAENVVKNDMKTAFYDLNLYSEKSYMVRVNVTNKAGLHTAVSSAITLIDSTQPLPGAVKITTDWNKVRNYQHSISTIHGLFALAENNDAFKCLNQLQYFPINPAQMWPAFSGNFTNEYAIINRTGAYLGIGYSSDLSTMIKSGIISAPQSLKNGNYTMQLQIAAGTNVITTAALISDTITVPFTIRGKPSESIFDNERFENVKGLQSSDDDNITLTTTSSVPPVKPTAGAKSENTHPENKTVLNKVAYGIGIHFLGYKLENNTDWWHVFWARNKLTTTERWFRLTFDPTKGNHEYTVKVKQSTTSLDQSIDVTLFVDTVEMVSISGFEFNADIKLAYLTWNEEDYYPPIDIFNPFYSVASLTRISIPDKNDIPCLHGKGFFDGESGIKKVEVGVSDSKTDVGNIVPLRPFQEFCFPCIDPCIEMCTQPCNDTRLTEEFSILPIQIGGLSLEPITANSSCLNASVEQECNSTSYYLNIKLTNYAGLSTIVNSNGIQVDVTPPVCEYVRCLDPNYNDDAPTSYLGSDSTIGAYWDCREDVSSIEFYTVAIMSQNESQVVMNSTNVGLKTKVKFGLGSGMFEHRKYYEVQVTATNTAGQNYTSSCSIQVFLYPPKVSVASIKPLFSDAEDAANDDAPYWTSSQDTVGLEWRGYSNDTEFFELEIGSSSGRQDIFPSVKVGQNATGSVAIQDGKLKLGTTLTNTYMLDIRDRTNMTEEEIDQLARASERKKAFFFLEPGRCMHMALNAIGYSHLKGNLKARTVCIKRSNDAVSTSGHALFSKGKTTNGWRQKKVPSPEVVIDAEVLSGSLYVGTLNESDKTSAYGSAATADYQPYIADPDITGDQTTRMLRHRIQRFCGLSFFIAPSPAVTVGNIAINVTVSPSCSKDTDYQPALIYWDVDYQPALIYCDVDRQQWTHTDEGCHGAATSFIDYEQNIYMAEVCQQRGHGDRTRRQTIGSIDSPLHFELARIGRAFPNTPPTIVSDTLMTAEDNFKEILVDTSDPDDDVLIFEILQQGENAECIIGNTTGILNCTLEENFNGLNTISVKVTETGLPDSEQPMIVEKSITLNITATPDPTQRFFVDRFGRLHRDKRPYLYHSLAVEANNTESVFAGTIILTDMDDDEVFKIKTNFSTLGNATFTLTEVELEDVRKVMLTRFKTVRAYDVNLAYSSNLNGEMKLSVIAQTSSGEYTPSVTIHLYVLEYPCVYGECTHPSLGRFACDNTDRASSFDGYACKCRPGYQGTWCHVEIDECAADPCPSLFDCEDLVDNFECSINVGKLMAVLISCAFFWIVAAFIIYRLRQKLQQRKLRQSQVSLTEEDELPDVDTVKQPLAPSTTLAANKIDPKVSIQKEDKTPIDLSAIAGFTNAIGYKLPPHMINKLPNTHACDTETKRPLNTVSTKPPGSKLRKASRHDANKAGQSKTPNRPSKPLSKPSPMHRNTSATHQPMPTMYSRPISSLGEPLKPEAGVTPTSTTTRDNPSNKGADDPSGSPMTTWPEPMADDSSVISVSSVWDGQREPPPSRCLSAASQRTTSTIEENQITLSDRMSEIDV